MTTYVYNEHDENQVLTMRNKLKKKKCTADLFCVIILMCMFLMHNGVLLTIVSLLVYCRGNMMLQSPVI